MAEATERPLNELLSHSMVDIYVGPENTHWVLHEKLLSTRSKFFSKVFQTKYKNVGSGSKTFGLPDEDDGPFQLFVGWLYSAHVPPPEEESELGDLFDLYLMGEKWQIAGLVKATLDAVRKFYRLSGSYPGLRRVQYVYANSDEDSPMRQLLVSSVARMMVVEDSMPPHWEKALKKNGQLAVDIIRTVQTWKLNPESVPDARHEAQILEKEKVEQVVQAEENPDEDTLVELTNGIENMTNGVDHHTDEDEE